MELLVRLLINVNYFHPTMQRISSSADNLCKQFGPRSGPTECRSRSGPKQLDTLMVFLKVFFEKVNFEISEQTTDFKRMKNYPACKELRATSQESSFTCTPDSCFYMLRRKSLVSTDPVCNDFVLILTKTLLNMKFI